MLKLTAFDKIIRAVAKEFGYQTKPRLAWKRGPELTTVVVLETYPSSGPMPTLGVMPNVFFPNGVSPTLKIQGGVLLACRPDNLPDFEFKNVFVNQSRKDPLRVVTQEEMRPATIAMFQWTKENLVNEAKLKAELLSSEERYRKAYMVDDCIMSWAKGAFRMDDWLVEMWPRCFIDR